MREREALLQGIDPDTRIEVIERRGESTEILRASPRRDIHVIGGVDRGALGDGRERADHDVLDMVTVERGEHMLSAQSRTAHSLRALDANCATFSP